MSDRGSAPGSGRLRRLSAPVALVLGSLVVGIVLTEVAHRVARRWVCVGRPTNTLYEPKADYGWGHRPNAEGWMYACLGRAYEWQNHVRTNAQGLFGPDRPYEKPPGVRRVLLLGDSMTEAVQVPLAETFPVRLERGLHSQGTTAEVLNAGVAAFGNDNELMYFRAEGVRYAPDLVVLVFNVANDVIENSPELNRKMYGGSGEHLVEKTSFRLDEDGRLVPIPPAPWTRQPIGWWSQIENRLYLLRAIRRVLTTPAKPVEVVPNLTVWGAMLRTPDAEWGQAWAVTEALVRQLRADVEKTGARFAVAIMPNREIASPSIWRMVVQAQPAFEVQYDPEAPVRRMAAFLAREGIAYVDLLPPLRAGAEATGITGFFAADVHLDVTGHERVAGALVPFVAGLLAQPDGGVAR